ncbi:hypothetical protein M011DRAFT_341814 [Sporormia fimetaria CBS 119925]|uniref:Uncharacterized protein n=1 Tax=Sporormia fimetaria CBS 119925 TaxID=1340428 RepID=A0A6A6VE66_9PLEO|nr:hypothetical protein M011DRAFT_341814 [Sporormia fimetaria CBS 119925]
MTRPLTAYLYVALASHQRFPFSRAAGWSGKGAGTDSGPGRRVAGPMGTWRWSRGHYRSQSPWQITVRSVQPTQRAPRLRKCRIQVASDGARSRCNLSVGKGCSSITAP